MKLRIVILLLIFNLGGGCSCDCDKVPKYFDVNGMNAKVSQLEKRFGNQDESEYLLDSAQQVSYDKLIITLVPNVTYYGTVSMFKNISFISAAYACSCGDNMPGTGGTIEQISEINIVSAQPFTSSGTTAEPLNKYFEIYDFTATGTAPRKFVDLDSLVNTRPKLPWLPIRLRLKTRPTGSLTHKFTIQYKQTNGEVYTTRTQEIKFN